MNIAKNIVFAGEAGQGIETAGKVVAKTLHKSGFHTFFIPEYMSRIKGGCNSSLVKVSDNFAPYFEKRINVLFVINKCAVEHLGARISPDTRVIETPFGANNFWSIGAALKLFGIDFEAAKSLIGKILEQKDNLKWLTEGFASSDIAAIPDIAKSGAEGQFLSGNDAVSLGCLQGGCNFIAFYPMSPSTALSTFMCKREEVIAQQVEDEIAAINMALGASYAGARAMVSTAGGGFALMCEGLSLSGMLEMPVVIHLAQRPSPATGLPTRDAQEDLNLALYAGHGEFPRIILSPSTLQNSYQIGAKAFNLADKFEVPVFILTQQSSLESEFVTEEFGEIAKTVSQRKIPNFSEELVCVDSDEHDELGRITEDLEVRQKMQSKRLFKLDLIKEELENDPLGFDFVGHGGVSADADNSENLIVSWGGNYHVIQAAIAERKEDKRFSHLHIIQLHPLQSRLASYLNNAKTLAIIEQNATGQLATLIEHKFGVKFERKLLKYNGEPLALEDVREFLNGF